MEPGKALIAFDTAAALLNVSISSRSDADLADRSYASSIVEAPAPIGGPPEEIIISTVCVPVEPGFFCNGLPCPGSFPFDHHPRRERRLHHHARSFSGEPPLQPAPGVNALNPPRAADFQRPEP